MEKLYELHDERRLRPHRRRHPADPQRPRLPRRPAPAHPVPRPPLFRLLMVPTGGYLKAVNVATQAFLRTIAKVVGGEVVEDAVAFFQAFEGMEQGFRERADAVLELLDAPTTAFVLVASPRRDAVAEARVLRRAAGGAGIAGAGAGRQPASTRASATGSAAAERAGRRSALAALGREPGRLPRHRRAARSTTSPTLRQAVTPAPVARVPFLADDVHDLDRPGRDRRPPLRPAAPRRRRQASRVGARLGLDEGGGRVLERLGHRDDAVEAGGVQQPGQRRPVAGTRPRRRRARGPGGCRR